MRVPKIYLETTVFNWYFEEDRGSFHAGTLELFREISMGEFSAYTSDYVIGELLLTKDESRREKMLALINEYKIKTLEFNEEAEILADIYVAEGLIPSKFRTDGLHIAIAAVNNLDIIISMNFNHIVKRKTRLIAPAINTLRGYKPIEIYNPLEVVNHEYDE